LLSTSIKKSALLEKTPDFLLRGIIMSVKKTQKAPLPRWAWLFAAACFAIPVLTIGGAIPTGIGVAGGFYCLAVAREPRKTIKRRVIYCTATTMACWMLFLGLAGGVMAFRSNHSRAANTKRTRSGAETQLAKSSGFNLNSPEKQKDILADESTRREIYRAAIRMRKHLERAEDRRSDYLSRGLKVDVSEKQIEHIKKMAEKDLEFKARFYEITRAQLDEIIAEGDRNRWPVE
jgi:hypothetical protein